MSWAQEAEVGDEASQKIRVPNANFQKFAVSPFFFLEWQAECLVGSDTKCSRVHL